MRAAISDWEQFAATYGESDAEEFSLQRLNPGDTLRIVTQHTNYVFTVISGREVQLKSSRADRPSGAVKIWGCGFGFCHAFKPGTCSAVAGWSSHSSGTRSPPGIARRRSRRSSIGIRLLRSRPNFRI